MIDSTRADVPQRLPNFPALPMLPMPNAYIAQQQQMQQFVVKKKPVAPYVPAPVPRRTAPPQVRRDVMCEKIVIL